jgi:hypothetical protein
MKRGEREQKRKLRRKSTSKTETKSETNWGDHEVYEFHGIDTVKPIGIANRRGCFNAEEDGLSGGLRLMLGS